MPFSPFLLQGSQVIYMAGCCDVWSTLFIPIYAPTLLLFASVFKVFSLLRKKKWYRSMVLQTLYLWQFCPPNPPKIIDNYSRPFFYSTHLLKIVKFRKHVTKNSARMNDYSLKELWFSNKPLYSCLCKLKNILNTPTTSCEWSDSPSICEMSCLFFIM